VSAADWAAAPDGETKQQEIAANGLVISQFLP
jgi:hypothetical protein